MFCLIMSGSFFSISIISDKRHRCFKVDVSLSLSLLLQMSWAAGTQCVAKGDNKKPKPGELAYHKGDIITIVDTSTVISCEKKSYRQLLLEFVFII